MVNVFRTCTISHGTRNLLEKDLNRDLERERLRDREGAKAHMTNQQTIKMDTDTLLPLVHSK